MRIVKPSVSLIWKTPDLEKQIERSGRICYKSEDKITKKSSGKFIRMIIKRGHESVLEHGVVSLKIICDRGISHEFVRSRIGFSYSQESTRYCNYSKDKFDNQITVICPSYISNLDFEEKDNLEILYQWRKSCLESEKVYNELVEKQNVSPQIARSVLPTCLKTEIVVTANIRAWRNFLRMRLDKSAHPDMIFLAHLIYEKLNEICPNCFFDISDAKV